MCDEHRKLAGEVVDTEDPGDSETVLVQVRVPKALIASKFAALEVGLDPTKNRVKAIFLQISLENEKPKKV